MPTLFQATDEHIGRLTPVQQTSLLLRLLRLEANAMDIGPLAVSGSLAITNPDGGEDARIEWSGDPTPSPRGNISDRLCMFQSKATDEFGPGDCAAELFRSRSNNLKPRVEEVLSRGGTYCLFLRRPINQQERLDCMAEMRHALRDRRGAYENAKIRILGRSEISDWTNQHLSAVAWVLNELGVAAGSGLIPWSTLKGYPFCTGSFIPTAEQADLLVEIRKWAQLKGGVYRLIGPAGLGKTKLIAEAFREDAKDIPQSTLSDTLIYYNAHGADRSNVTEQLAAIRNRSVHGVLVVDDCPLKLHSALKQEVLHESSRLTLITISAESQTDGRVRTIGPATKEEIGEIVKARADGLSPHIVNRIAELSSGNIFVALELLDAVTHDPTAPVALSNFEVCTRLLQVEFDPNEVYQFRLSILSLFVQIQFESETGSETEFKFIAERILGISVQELEDVVRRFQGSGVIRRLGDYLSVDPYPLALCLAREGLSRLARAQRTMLFTGADVPARLQKSFTERMSQIGWYIEGADSVAELVGINGPFDSAEVVLSEHGSRLFLSLVEVNPEACLSLLERLLRGLPRKELTRGKSQFSLIFAVQKLCWHPNLFIRSALVLRQFAGEENEHWNAAARRDFLTLFHIGLPGTEADLSARRQVIDRLLTSLSLEDHRLAIAALGESLQAHQFSRSGGPEEQGGRFPREDYQPKNAEVKHYWVANLRTLTGIACDGSNQWQYARETFAKNMNGPALKGLTREVLDFARQIADAHPEDAWMSGIDALQRLASVLGSNADVRKLLADVKARMIPTTIQGRIEAFVTKPSWWDYSEEGQSSYDKGGEKAKAFAVEIVNDFEKFLSVINLVQTGEQRQAFVFGQELVKLGADYRTIVSRSIDSLRTIDPSEANAGFLAGVLKSCQEIDAAYRDSILDHLESDSNLAWVVLPLTQGSIISANDLDRLVRMTGVGRMKVGRLVGLSYGSVLSHLPPDIVSSFTLRISTFGCEGEVAALDILSMYSFGNPSRSDELDRALGTLLRTGSFLTCESFDGQSAGYHWATNVERLLKKSHDLDMAEAAAVQIVRFAESGGRLYTLDHIIDPVLKILFESYKDTWPIFASAILRHDMASWDILSLFKGDDFGGQSKRHLLEALGMDFFLKWCDENPDAPRAFGSHVPILRVDGAKWSCDPIAREFILRFGERKDVLDEVSGGLWSFGWTGTPIPQYEAMRGMLEDFSTDTRPALREWALKNLAAVVESIRKEEKRLANERMGVHEF